MANTLDTHKPATVAIDELSCTAHGSAQWLLENRQDIAPITYENDLRFFICGEEGFNQIVEDLRNAKSTVDLVCWGFDPCMEVERKRDKWPRGTTYGELLEEITTRKVNPVTVRLMVWYQETASAKQNNVPGYSDNGGYWANPAAFIVSGPSPYASEARHKTAVAWWKRHRPKGNCSGENPRLLVAFRSIEAADAQQSLADEEDKPVDSFGNPTSEKNLLVNYPTHHQKPILIDYAYDGGQHAIGYVMGLNSVTDYWDRIEHEIDDPLREALTAKKLQEELAHEVATQGEPSTNVYKHGRPYQDYACRIVGPALKRLHHNFVSDWNIFAPDHKVAELAELPPNIPREPFDPMHGVQIVRTHPREREKTIKELYYHSITSARNYIYIENQYFFYPAFARELKKTRKAFIDDWMKQTGKDASEMPMLHLFIVVPHPEDDGMVPRTYDMVTELGESNTMQAQGGLVDRGKVDQNYSDARQGKNGTKVLDRPSVGDLANAYGLKVSLARLRSSGLDRNHQMGYREIYIHSKLMIIDDVFLTVGSANLNQRSMSSDSEINVGLTGLKYAGTQRRRIFDLHWGGALPGNDSSVDWPDIFGRWQRRMATNEAVRKKGKEPMKGFLLPFEDCRATATMHASMTIPTDGNTAIT